MILEGEYGKLNDDAKKIVEQVLKSDKSGVDMVQTFLNATKLESGEVKFEMAPVNLKSIVETVISEEKTNTDIKGLNISFDAPELEYTVNADKTQIREVVFNLIDNAIRYTPEGTVVVKLEHVNNAVRLSVKDSGIGIEKDDMVRLFTKGGRGKDSRLTNPNSNGYGLYVLKNIVDAHHGRVWAESEGKGKGSTFFVEI